MPKPEQPRSEGRSQNRVVAPLNIWPVRIEDPRTAHRNEAQAQLFAARALLKERHDPLHARQEIHARVRFPSQDTATTGFVRVTGMTTPDVASTINPRSAWVMSR